MRRLSRHANLRPRVDPCEDRSPASVLMPVPLPLWARPIITTIHPPTQAPLLAIGHEVESFAESATRPSTEAGLSLPNPDQRLHDHGPVRPPDPADPRTAQDTQESTGREGARRLVGVLHGGQMTIPVEAAGWTPSNPTPSPSHKSGPVDQAAIAHLGPQSPAPDEDGVRPMSLPPTSPSFLGTATQSDPAVSPSDLKGAVAAHGYFDGSGGGGGYPDQHPGIHFSGASYHEEVTGQYVVDDDIPVGFVTYIDVFEREPEYNIVSTSISWSGGTPYSSDFAGGPWSAAPQSMSVGMDVQTNDWVYSFIADPMPREYTVSLSVQYDNGASGNSTVRFTSARPSVSIIGC
ncbi:hypothetical protein [Tautonia rosea]|uniref:hypothetical protein n=1 Tax=Tautonia rosea TaxID=2728037 RepID=UPI001472CAC6|nr:hypothetical protein [Tautonia rosea]